MDAAKSFDSCHKPNLFAAGKPSLKGLAVTALLAHRGDRLPG